MPRHIESHLKSLRHSTTLKVSWAHLEEQNTHATFLRRPAFETSSLFSSLLRKKSRFSTTCYPNPRWCPLLKDPAWRTLCRNKQVPLWCAVLLFGGMEDWQSLAPLPACKHPNRAHHPSGSSMVHHSQRIPSFFPTYTPWQHPSDGSVLLWAWHELIWNTSLPCWREENTTAWNTYKA